MQIVIAGVQRQPRFPLEEKNRQSVVTELTFSRLTLASFPRLTHRPIFRTGRTLLRGLRFPRFVMNWARNFPPL